MSRCFGIALALLLAGWVHAASAQVAPGMGCSQSPCPPSQGGTGVNNGSNTLTVGSSFYVPPSIGYELIPNAAGTAAGGSGYTAGTVGTLLGGTCSTAPTIVLWSAGASPIYTVQNPGSCSQPPPDPVSFTASAGSGATLTLAGHWGLHNAASYDTPFISTGPNGYTFYPPTLAVGVLNPTLGPVCFGNTGSCGGNGNGSDGMGGGTGMTGAENASTAWHGLAQVTTGSFLTACGFNALGHEVDGNNSTACGNDTLKWAIHAGAASAYGQGAGTYLIKPTDVSIFGEGSYVGQTLVSLNVTGAISNGGACELTTSATGSLPTSNNRVFVQNVDGATGCNGEFAYTVTDGTHITLTGSTFGGSYTGGGSFLAFGNYNANDVAVFGGQSWSSTSLQNVNSVASLGGKNFVHMTGGNGNITGIGTGIGTTCTTAAQVMILSTDFHGDCGSSNESFRLHISVGGGDIISALSTNAPATSPVTIAGPTIISGAGFLVGNLPSTANAGAVTGARSFVTDATACSTFGGTLTGSGSTKCPVFYNGSAWVQGALEPANDNGTDQRKIV